MFSYSREVRFLRNMDKGLLQTRPEYPTLTRIFRPASDMQIPESALSTPACLGIRGSGDGGGFRLRGGKAAASVLFYES